MKKKIILSIFLLILILTGLGVYCINGDKISKNVYVQNINIGDLTKDEAKDKLSSEYKIQSFKFNYKEKTWDIDPKTLDINYDLDKTINKAYDVNRKGNIIQNIFKSLQNLAGIKTKVNLVMNCDEDKLKSELEKISKERSPLLDCSITTGTKLIFKISFLIYYKRQYHYTLQK